MKLFLASASPRRKELMALLPYAFEIHVPDFDERAFEEELLKEQQLSIEEHVMALAKAKGEAAFLELEQLYPHQDFAVISADTIVLLEDEIMGKGENREKSIAMLQKLNGTTHLVKTGVCVKAKQFEKSFMVTTEVSFAPSSQSLIERYVDLYKPFDKAGAYGMQDGGGLLVKEIKGSYHNIIGLPIRELYECLEELKVGE